MRRLLEVLDDFELALIHAAEKPDYEKFLHGVELVYAKLLDSLRAEGLDKMDAQGKPFDPEVHEALLQTGEGDGEPGRRRRAQPRLHAEGPRAPPRRRPGRAAVRRTRGRRGPPRVVRHRLLRCPRRAQERDGRRDQEGVSEARAEAPPRHQPGQRGGGGAVQGDLRRVRGARGRGEACSRTTASGRWARRASAPASRAAPPPAVTRAGFNYETVDVGDLGDLLGGMFGGAGGGRARGRGGGRARPTARGADLETEVRLTLRRRHGGGDRPGEDRGPRGVSHVSRLGRRARHRSPRCAPTAAASGRSR